MTQPLFSVWEGVFKSFEEAGGDLDAFESYLTDTLGFGLKFKSKFIRSILNQEGVFPNFGLPPTHRIERALNAIFYRL